MKRWKIHYELTNAFSDYVTEHVFLLRTYPYVSSAIKLLDFNCSILPKIDYRLSSDSFGNKLILGDFCNEFLLFKVNIDFTVESNYSNFVLEPKDELHQKMFITNTELTDIKGPIKEFNDYLTKFDKLNDYEFAYKVCNELYNNFKYSKGSTNIYTTASQAFSQGCGVCQDYAHILLALLRSRKIICRYVAGAIPGEGETHAWCEVLFNKNWIGIDPTHNRICSDTYVPFAVGRDARDCSLNRGTFKGRSMQHQQVSLSMREL